MSIFTFKIIACITMVLDHIKYAIPETTCFATQYLGRIAFPVFAFLVGEGYCHTSNLKRYSQRFILFAFISQIPFMLFRTLVGQWQMLNIMFTLILGLLTIILFDKLDKKYFLSIPAILLVAYLGAYFKVDYGWYGVLSVWILYATRKTKGWRFFGFALLTGLYYYPRLRQNVSFGNVISYICTIFPALLFLCYHGKLGRKTKYFYYIFYPVHMLILFGISLV